MVPPMSNRPLELVAGHQLESEFEISELIKETPRSVVCELEVLESILGNESIQWSERDKFRTLVPHLESIRSFIEKSLEIPIPTLQISGILDLVVEVKYVVDDLFVDTERYTFDDSKILGWDCFQPHFCKLLDVVHNIKPVEKESLVASLSEGSCSSYNVHGEAVIGFEVRQREIVVRLTTGLGQLEGISIIGMAGIGKTTFAYMLYNHPSILDRFRIRAWTSLSKSYEKKNILHDILSCIVPEDDPILLMSVDDMGEKVYNCLSENRYLIVIDDIWDVQAWNDLKHYFPACITGSKILITSRIENAALNIKVGKYNSSAYYFPRLTRGESWELFKGKVNDYGYLPVRLWEIGMKIVAKCKGLPLLIIVIARLLSKEEKTEKYWRQVDGNMSSIIHKIMDSPCSDHNLTEMLVDHQFITIANRAVELELENLELLLDHESVVFGKRDEKLSLVQDLKFIYSFIRNVQDTPTALQSPGILDFVLEIKSVVEDLLDDTNSYIRVEIFRDLKHSGMECFFKHSQQVADMVPKIKCINKDTFNFQGNGSTSPEALSIQEACSNSIPQEKIVIGFEGQQKELLDRLIGGRKQLEVIPVIGMAGIGKTTLANMLYNHLPILCHFHVRAWTSLSQSYQKNLLHNILSSIVCEDDPVLFMSEDDMGEKLHKSLMGNRYLIVIDDIWDTQAWNDVEMYFPNNENGSRKCPF